MRYLSLVGLLLVACKTDTEPEPEPATDGEPTPIDTGSPPVVDDTGVVDTAAPTPPYTIPYDCYSLYERDLGDDGTVDDVGFDVWDAVEIRPIHGQRDRGDDGTIDETWAYTWDTRGRIARIERDDGVATAETYTWDDADHLLEYVVDDFVDGIPDYRLTQSWDTDGNILVYAMDDDGDGADELRWDYVYEDGLLVSAVVEFTGDGLTDGEARYTHDAEGRILEIVVDYYDLYNDDVDFRMAYSYTDPTAEIGSYTEDWLADGVLERRIAFAFDPEGRQVSNALDEYADGTWDTEDTWSYDAGGALLAHVRFVSADYGYGYDLTTHEVSVYDPLGRRVEFLYSEDEDDVVSSRAERSSWVFTGTCP